MHFTVKRKFFLFSRSWSDRYFDFTSLSIVCISHFSQISHFYNHSIVVILDPSLMHFSVKRKFFLFSRSWSILHLSIVCTSQISQISHFYNHGIIVILHPNLMHFAVQCKFFLFSRSDRYFDFTLIDRMYFSDELGKRNVKIALIGLSSRHNGFIELKI